MKSSPNDGARCRWITPTVLLDAPYWVEAEASPWTCLRDATPRPLATTEECATCPRFEAAGPAPAVRHPERPDFFR
jgi:hypothetical protein